MRPLTEVFTVAEIARAAGVPQQAIEQLTDSGRLTPVAGTRFYRAADAIRAARQARLDVARTCPSARTLHPHLLSLAPSVSGAAVGRERRISTLGSSLVHAACLAMLVLWSMPGTAETATPVQQASTRLVFWAGPGPGGGGGGAGRAPRMERPRVTRPVPARSELSTKEPDPLPSKAIAYPVAFKAGEARQNELEENGTGAGLGPGFDEGTGGGEGGGPFRPGSGIDPPRLLREVKAQYTEDARRQGVTGGVVLEIVVRHDGTVGEVTVLQGLGHGLDERAIAAVRSWQFSPARRKGQPVAVVVEVEVDFSLR
jgi:TonB family protein